MPIHRKINKNFFKKWSPEMAYILGFLSADGSIYRTKRNTYFLEFQITDKDLLYRIREALNSDHKITEKNSSKGEKMVYRLQIGSKEIFEDLVKIGITQAKSKTIKLPSIPRRFFAHFLRGYFDGDGNIVSGIFKRKDKGFSEEYFRLRFTSGSKTILDDIRDKLNQLLKFNGSILRYGGAWRLSYSNKNSIKICNFIYKDIRKNNLIYLLRKYNIFQQFVDRKMRA